MIEAGFRLFTKPSRFRTIPFLIRKMQGFRLVLSPQWFPEYHTECKAARDNQKAHEKCVSVSYRRHMPSILPVLSNMDPVRIGKQPYPSSTDHTLKTSWIAI